MNWKDCVDLLVRYDLGDRFTWPPDAMGFDCEPAVFTIQDVWGAVSWVWTWPGDALLSIPEVAQFFVMEVPIVGHWFSTITGWVLLLVLRALMSER